MAELIRYVVVAPDGSRTLADLPDNICKDYSAQAPNWLVQQMALSVSAQNQWRLYRSESQPVDLHEGIRSESAEAIPKLFFVRGAVAGAMGAPSDPRQIRLKAERERLERLNAESDHVRVEPLNVMDGSEPEHYRVTFLCRGIIGIEPSTQAPIYGERHQVEIRCDDGFPSEVPQLRWVTPIWHPNIQHNGNKAVCTNPAEWLGGMGLDDLCRLMFEMVQYKNYHADTTTRPYPLDHAAATWVREYAEPRGLVKKGQIFIDDQPFTRVLEPVAITLRPVPSSTPERRIRVIPKTDSVESKASSSGVRIVNSRSREFSDTAPTTVGRIRITKKE